MDDTTIFAKSQLAEILEFKIPQMLRNHGGNRDIYDAKLRLDVAAMALLGWFMGMSVQK
ncbi:MAG: hypothetical protein IIC79_04615 [Chloroflexi bacterium]|nr:hypothetical protein [Chloroflexota bacterium]